MIKVNRIDNELKIRKREASVEKKYKKERNGRRE